MQFHHLQYTAPLLTTTIKPIVAAFESAPVIGFIIVASTTPTTISQAHMWMEASTIQNTLGCVALCYVCITLVCGGQATTIARSRTTQGLAHVQSMPRDKKT